MESSHQSNGFEEASSNRARWLRIRFGELTKREIEIALLVAEHYTSVQIGEKLNIAENTVETHRRSIRKKMNVEEGGLRTALLSFFRFYENPERNGHDRFGEFKNTGFSQG